MSNNVQADLVIQWEIKKKIVTEIVQRGCSLCQVSGPMSKVLFAHK